MRPLSTLTAAFLAAGMIVTGADRAPAQTDSLQALQYDAEVFGMVCNQCAYGVEQTLLHTDGIEEALVDLTNGDVRALLQKNGAIPPADLIVRKIRDQGLTVRGLRGTLVGTVVRAPDGWALEVGSTRYQLVPSDSEQSLKQLAGRQVRVEGTFEQVDGMEGASSKKPARFVLETIRPAATS